MESAVNGEVRGIHTPNLKLAEQHPLQFLTAEDVANFLRVNKAIVYDWIKQKKLKASNLGTPRRPLYRVLQNDLSSFLAKKAMMSMVIYEYFKIGEWQI